MSENESWAIARFQESMADIRWAKERGSRVVQWSILIQVGLIAMEEGFSELKPTLVLGLLAFTVAAMSIKWACELHLFQRSTRERINGLLPDDLKDKASEADRDHVQYLILNLGAIAVALGLSLWAMSG
jgi:hypothetical protein